VQRVSAPQKRQGVGDRVRRRRVFALAPRHRRPGMDSLSLRSGRSAGGRWSGGDPRTQSCATGSSSWQSRRGRRQTLRVTNGRAIHNLSATARVEELVSRALFRGLRRNILVPDAPHHYPGECAVAAAAVDQPHRQASPHCASLPLRRGPAVVDGPARGSVNSGQECRDAVGAAPEG
jgi:hypothetical protein